MPRPKKAQGDPNEKATPVPAKRTAAKREAPKRTVARTLDEDEGASVRRVSKRKLAAMGPRAAAKKASVVPEAMTRSIETLKERIEAAKYYVPPSVQPQEEPLRHDLPGEYRENRIVLLVRDPWWVHAYWEITPDRLDLARSFFGEAWPQAKSILRVYDVTDIEFSGHNAHRSFDIELSGMATNWYINVGAPNRSWCVDIGVLGPHDQFFVLARSNAVRTPRDGMSEVLDEQWMDLDVNFERMYALSGGFQVGSSSLGLREQMQERLRGEGASGSGAISSFGSPVFLGEKKRGFWFVLDCELIVYGATEPDATVTMQGRPLRLRSDGTFTARFALPDGRQEIETTAASADGVERRTITPVVTRKTHARQELLQPV